MDMLGGHWRKLIHAVRMRTGDEPRTEREKSLVNTKTDTDRREVLSPDDLADYLCVPIVAAERTFRRETRPLWAALLLLWTKLWLVLVGSGSI